MSTTKSNLCAKHGKKKIHILGCEDCVKESDMTELEMLALATKRLNARLDRDFAVISGRAALETLPDET